MQEGEPGTGEGGSVLCAGMGCQGLSRGRKLFHDGDWGGFGRGRCGGLDTGSMRQTPSRMQTVGATRDWLYAGASIQ